MRFSVLGTNERNLARGAALIVLAGMAAGCSSQVARFGGGVDDIFTASTPNQRQIIRQDNQPYPGDQIAAAPSGSVNRSAVQPVDLSAQPVARNSLPPVDSRPAPAAQPVVASAPVEQPKPKVKPAPVLDTTTTGTVKPLAPPKAESKSEPQVASAEEPAGWSRAGGTQVTVKDGETVFNLSRRFGVPANVIMQVNGLDKSGGLKSGQKVVIPTYVYSRKAPVSAPDSDPNVADAKSSRGTKYDVPPGKVPLPASAPTDKLAVLPQQPKLKEGEAAQQTASSADAKAKPVDAKPKPAGAGGSYVVVQGDSLSKIAKKTGVGVASIKAANGMQDGLLRIGQTLKIPTGGEVPVNVASAKPANVDPIVTGTPKPAKPAAENSNGTLAAYTPPKKSEKLIQQAEEDNAAAPDATGIGRMRWPARGRVIAAYGKGSDGIDISVPEGTPVKAAENGVVIYAGDGLKEFGNTVLVRHEDGLVTVYGHASELKVSRGQKVKRGEEIAVSGMSGTTNAPKLHFEVRKNSAPVDPSTYLE